jgi:SAM-dependent methyltransferase
MEARAVWDTWRRILTDDELVERVLHSGGPGGPGPGAAAPSGLTTGEAAILADYAGTPAATETNIGMYRRGLVRNALGALSHVPLARHLLLTSTLDADEVAADFARSTGYVDHGPNFWRVAGEFVAHLGGLPQFKGRSHQDALALDAAAVALVRRLGGSPVETWPDAVAPEYGEAGLRTDGRSTHFVATRAAVVVSSSVDLTPWIEDPDGFDPDDELEPSERHWLIYLPSPEADLAYAELSERSAHAFDVLSEPRTASELSTLTGLSPAEVLEVVGSVAQLGVVTVDGDAWGSGDGLRTLSDDAFVMLDPAVEVLAAEVGEHRLLCHRHFEVGMAVPPGDGLLDFVSTLRGEPIGVGALREQFDDQELVSEVLANLSLHGFVHVTTPFAPTDDELGHLRDLAAEARLGTVRRSIVVDLDARMSIEDLCACFEGEAVPPEVLLRCTRLADHAMTLAALARLYQSGALPLHQTVVQTADATGDRALCRSLLRLGASVHVEGVTWPAPDRPIPWLAELTQHCVAVHALMAPDLSLLDEEVRGRAVAWARSVFLSGLRLRLDAPALWPEPEPAVTDEAFVAVFDAVEALEAEIGDVQVVDLPSDEVVLGNTSAPTRVAEAEQPDLVDRFRAAYLRHRIASLQQCELDNTFSQTPEAEEKLVPAHEDLLPNHPDLLLLRPGSVLIDVCGGLGRVARRLAPAVGDEGLVISIEMLRCVSDRGRAFAGERNLANLHFRPGLAQRIPLPDGTVDAAVNEWTAGIWELGLGPAMVSEMARVVRPGGRIAVNHRLVRIPLTRLGQSWAQYEEIYGWMCDAFAHPDLDIVTKRVWGQIAPSMVGENATHWRKQFLPRIVNPFDITYQSDEHPGAHADVFLTMIAQRR